LFVNARIKDKSTKKKTKKEKKKNQNNDNNHRKSYQLKQIRKKILNKTYMDLQKNRFFVKGVG
ncbi:MAG: hypothetical protein K6T94_06880, partial [Paenibacillus sp.]|nr:hypothetical protein [Paenibacillus sp.]